MNIRRLSYGLSFSLAIGMFAVACGGEAPPPEVPPPPPPPVAAAPTAEPAAEPAPAASAAETAAPAEPPPPPAKPLKEKFAGKWQQDWSGDVKAAAEEAAKKAGGAKADQKKIDAALEKAHKDFKPESIELADGVLTWSVNGKPVHKFKYEVVKEDGQTLVVKAAEKDQVSKKEIKDELSYTFADDNTISVKNPDPKDKKGTILVFKHQ
jgi:hypothetical protein